MYERHENEQYFFDEDTIAHLSRFVQDYERPCCLCTPRVGERLASLGRDVAVLDPDERFGGLAGFRRFDLYRPEYPGWMEQSYGLILCDPPFFKVSLSQLFAAVRLLARHDFAQPLLIAWLERRASAIEGTFAPFGLRATGYRPGYQTVRPTEKNRIAFFGNLSDEEHRRLASAGA